MCDLLLCFDEIGLLGFHEVMARMLRVRFGYRIKIVDAVSFVLQQAGTLSFRCSCDPFWVPQSYFPLGR